MNIELYVDGNRHAWACLLVARKPDGTIAKKRLMSGVLAEMRSPSESAFHAAGEGLQALTMPTEVSVFTRIKKLTHSPSINDAVSWLYLVGHPLQKEVADEVERLTHVKSASELVSGGEKIPGGERLSDDDWLVQTMAAHRSRGRS